MFGHATSGIEEVVALSTLLGIHHGLLHDPRTLSVRVLILRAPVALGWIGRAETFLGHLEVEHFAGEADHFLVQLHAIDAGITPVEPSLTVVVNHHGRVDMIPAAVLVEGLADGVTEGASGRISHSHTDGHAARETGMGTDVPVELAVALDALAGPGTVVSPAETFQREGASVVGPVHHVGRTIHTPLLHPEEVGIVLIMTRIDIDAVAVHHRSRVARKPGLHKRILCRCLQSHQ